MKNRLVCSCQPNSSLLYIWCGNEIKSCTFSYQPTCLFSVCNREIPMYDSFDSLSLFLGKEPHLLILTPKWLAVRQRWSCYCICMSRIGFNCKRKWYPVTLKFCLAQGTLRHERLAERWQGAQSMLLRPVLRPRRLGFWCLEEWQRLEGACLLI